MEIKADNKKQGSSEEEIEYHLGSTMEFIKQTYQNMLKANIAPEMARMILPQNLYTEWYWSGTLMHLQEFVIYVVQKIHNGKHNLFVNKLMMSPENYFPQVGNI